MHRKTVLENGVRILSEKLDHFRSVSLGIWVNVGSREEVKKENGISHFIEHMVFEGTKKRTSEEIANSIESLGGELSAYTSNELTSFYVKISKKHFDKALEILSDIIINPTFDKKLIENQK